MKKILLYVVAVILSFSTIAFVVGCDKDDSGDASAVTGNFKYEIVTEERDSTTPKLDESGNELLDEFNNVVYEKEDYKFYKITGYTVSSDDATKIANGDFSGLTREITIPTDYTGLDGATEDLPVEEIGVSAFANQLIFTKVTVGDNIKKIGEGAFSGCLNLKTLELPFVGKSADAVNEERLFGFVFGTSSTDGTGTTTSITGKPHQRVDASGEVISSEEDISYYVPTALEKVVLRNVTEISECAFYGMTTLKEVVLPNTLTEIANHAFYGCNSLLTVKIPAAVTTIGDYAFSTATSLYDVEFANDSVLENIGAHAFDGCSLLKSSYVNDDVPLKLPSTVTTIGENAFASCTSIKTVDFSNLTSLKTIETSAFSGCTSLIQVKFGVNVGEKLVIRNGAFSGCTLLTKDGLYVNGANTGIESYLEVKTGAFLFELN